MFGRLFNTLSYRLDREEREWRSTNAIRRGLAYRRLRSLLVAAAEKPIRWPLTLLVILAVISVGAYFVPSEWLPRISDDFKAPDLIAYFSALWSVQATVAALVYPIVIAFVTLLLQGRHGAKAVLHIYLHDSTAILSGLSALALLALMGVQYLFLSAVRFEVSMVWLIVDGLWFLLNLGLTSFFLYQTFEFVRPDRRAETIRRYAANVTWPRELREHLASLRFLSAIESKLLPGHAYGEEHGEAGSRIWLGPSGVNIGATSVARLVPRNSRLTNVRFRLLAWATKRWLQRAASSESNQARNANGKLEFLHQRGTPVLLYPMLPGADYAGPIVLCGVTGAVPIHWLERFLIRHAFVFRHSTGPLLALTATDILSDLKTEAMLALRAGESQTFSDAVDEMVKLYSVLVEASAYRNTDGLLDNYVKVADRNHVFSRPVFRSWNQRLVDLFEAAAERISFNEAFFVDLIYVPNRLFSSMEEMAHADILAHFIELPPALFRRLGAWWVKTIEQQGITDHSACNPASLRPPFFATYDSVLRKFVSAWESLKNGQFPPHWDESPDWEELQSAGRYFERHLHITAVMVMECVHRGDKEGAERTLNVLQKWFAQLQFRSNGHAYFFHREKWLSFEVTEQVWGDAKAALDVEDGGYIEGGAPKALFEGALRNYWADVCCTVGYMLAIWGKHCPCERSLPARLLKALLFGETIRHEEDSIGGERPVSTASDLLAAILRQYHSDGAYRQGYRARLDRLVKRLTEATKVERVPGRIYLFWGADDLDSLKEGQLLVLLLLVTERWSPVAEVEQTIREWVREDDNKLRELADDLKQWQELLSHSDFAGFRTLFECVKSGQDTALSFDSAIETVITGIAEIIERIESIRKEAIRDLSVSQARLEEIGRWASARGFTTDSGAFPLRLFRSVEDSSEEFQSRSLIRGMQKGELTEPPMAPRAANEEVLFGKVVRDHVAAEVLTEALKQLEPREEEASSPEAYWRQMQQYAGEAKRAGRHPILLMKSRAAPKWIREWTHSYWRQAGEVPPGLKVWRDAKFKGSDEYLCNFNEVAVFRAPIAPDSSFLLTAESLRTLTFTHFPNGNFILVEAIPREAEVALVDLRLTWSFKLDLEPYPAVKLLYSPKICGRSR